MNDDHHHEHKDRWKHDGVRVIKGEQLDPNTAQTPGMFRQAAITQARVGAQKIWAETVAIEPNAKRASITMEHWKVSFLFCEARRGCDGETSSNMLPKPDQATLFSSHLMFPKPAEGEDLIDTLDVHIVAELSGYLGKFIAIHKLTDLQDEATDQREWGFRLLCKRQAELKRIIIETIEQKRPMVRFVEQFFGPLVDWLRRNKLKPAYQPLVSLFQDIAEKNMPFGPGMTFINPVEHRYVYCVNSAHTDFGIHKKRIKTLLVSHGLTDRINQHDSAIYFDAERARPILEAARETLTSTAAAEILGVDEEQFRTLVKVGFVGQVEERENERGYLRIPQAELYSFQSALLANAESVEHDEGEWGSLMELAHAFTMAFENILQLIIEGSVDARVITGPGGLLTRLRVSKLEVQRVRLQSLSDMQENFVTFEQALDLLGTSDVTLSQLLRRGYIKEKDYKRSSKMARLINEDSLQEFKSKFISLVDFCQKVGVNRVGMKKRLADIGVSPLFDDNINSWLVITICPILKSEEPSLWDDEKINSENLRSPPSGLFFVSSLQKRQIKQSEMTIPFRRHAKKTNKINDDAVKQDKPRRTLQNYRRLSGYSCALVGHSL
jgi:hypothetical protein